MRKMLMTMIGVIIVSTLIAQKKAVKPWVINYQIQPKSGLKTSGGNYIASIYTDLYPFTYEQMERYSPMYYDLDKEKAKAAYERDKYFAYKPIASANLKINGQYIEEVDGNPSFLEELSKSPHFMINLNIDDVRFIKVPEPSDKLSQMNADEILYTYALDSRVEITDMQGRVIWSTEIDHELTTYNVTKGQLMADLGYKTSIAMAKSEQEMKDVLIRRMMGEWKPTIRNIAIYANWALNAEFGKRLEYIGMGLFGVKGKDYKELIELQDEFFTVYTKFHALSAKKRAPKSDVDAFFIKAIPVWEKYLDERGSEMEENAVEGLRMNIIAGAVWVGDLEKAGQYLEYFPKATLDFEGGIVENDQFLPPTLMNNLGYAESCLQFYTHMKAAGDRLDIIQ